MHLRIKIVLPWWFEVMSLSKWLRHCHNNLCQSCGMLFDTNTGRAIAMIVDCSVSVCICLLRYLYHNVLKWCHYQKLRHCHNNLCQSCGLLFDTNTGACNRDDCVNIHSWNCPSAAAAAVKFKSWFNFSHDTFKYKYKQKNSLNNKKPVQIFPLIQTNTNNKSKKTQAN